MNQYVLAYQKDKNNLISFLLRPGKFWTFSYERQSDTCFQNQVKYQLGIDSKLCQVVKGFSEPFGDFGTISLVHLSSACLSREILNLEKISFLDLVKKIDPPRLRLVFVKAFQILSEEDIEGVSVCEVPRKPS